MKRRFIGVIALCLALFGFAPFSQIAFAGVTTQSFSYTGASQTWTVPTGITSLTYVVIGADGGGTTGGKGGNGAYGCSGGGGGAGTVSAGNGGNGGNGLVIITTSF